MGFTKPIEQYLFGNLLTKIHVFVYLKDIIRGGSGMESKDFFSKNDAEVSAIICKVLL